MDHSVKKITREGILIKKIDKKGQKSGEFIRPHLIQYYDDSLYISDQNKNGIQVFDIKLNYAYTIPCRYPVLDMHRMASNQILISWFDPLQKASLVLVDNLGKVMSHILLEEISGHSIMNAASFVVTRNSEIIIAYKYQDCICKINTNGGILWKKSLLKDIKTETKSILGFTLPEKIVYSDVAIDTTGNVFVLGGGYFADGKRQEYVL